MGPMAAVFQEFFNLNAYRILITMLLFHHMSLNTTYQYFLLSFIHIGALPGCVFFGVVAKFAPRRVALILGLLFGIVMFVVLSDFSGQCMMRSYVMYDRDYAINGNEGNRKIRAFVPAMLAKNMGNEFGFAAAFPDDYERLCLMAVFLGFGISSIAASATALLDLFHTDVYARTCFFIWGYFGWYWGQFAGTMWAATCYQMFDIPGAFISCIVSQALMLLCVLLSDESKGYEFTYAPEVTESPCYLKALYYGSYLWPQGAYHICDMSVYMVWDRFHINSSTVGNFSGLRPAQQLPLNMLIWSIILKHAYMPTIVLMFFSIFLHASPLNLSLMMEFFNYFRTLEGFPIYWFWVMVYPAFVGSYMSLSTIPILLGVVEGLRNLGHFMAMSRWPNQLFCGDPMACWRSQYLYSHAIFYNCGGDGGNISYVNWYCGMKSQKRQCCCPYRKLKPDAPEKCCPPCCLGPLVEETGGCPCPCCCASCAY
jgi:hypothetical protein